MTKTLLAVILGSAVVACGSDQGHGFDEQGSPAAGPDGSSGGSGSGSGGSTNGGSGSGASGSSGSGSSGSGSGSSGSGSSGGQSDGGSGPDAGYNTPTVCSSGKTWTGGDTGNAEMHPGVACDTCHKVLGSATTFPFDIAGTVYPTAHEPNDCDGLAGAQVVVTDAKGTDHTLAVNAAGNFYNLDYVLIGAIPTPYTAKVVLNGKTREMITPQTNGDCNSCHTEQGDQAAPGRIMAP
jgi:hypothetical protein